MELARRVGLDVAPVELTTSAGRHALLVERFDRTAADHRWRMVSALTIGPLRPTPSRTRSRHRRTVVDPCSWATIIVVDTADLAGSISSACRTTGPASQSQHALQIDAHRILTLKFGSGLPIREL